MVGVDLFVLRGVVMVVRDRRVLVVKFFRFRFGFSCYF